MRRLGEEDHPFLNAKVGRGVNVHRLSQVFFTWLLRCPRPCRFLPLLALPVVGALLGWGAWQSGRLWAWLGFGIWFVWLAANLIAHVLLSLREGRDLEARQRFLRRFVTVSFVIYLAAFLAVMLLFQFFRERVSP